MSDGSPAPASAPAPSAPVEPLAAAPLETALVGPAPRGLRGAAAAVRFYGEHAAAVPRPARLDRALFGVGQVVRAARLVAADPALRRAALLPTLLTFVGCAALAAAATALHASAGGDEVGLAPFQAFLVAFVALASMPPTILQRLWLGVAVEARRALGATSGEDPFRGDGVVRLAVRESGKAIRQAIVVSIGIVPLVWLVRILPLGREESAVVAGAWAFYWIVVDAFELPLEVVPGPRRGAPEPWYARLLDAASARSRLLRPLRALARFLRRLTRPW